MAHRSEQGNVLGFVLVGALLVVLLLGGIYVVRHAISGSGSNDIATKNQPETNSSTADDPDNKTNSSESSSGSQAEPGDQAQKDSSDKNSSNNQSSSTNPSGATGQTGTLPQTGPADTLVSVVGAALLAGASLSYARSRRLI